MRAASPLTIHSIAAIAAVVAVFAVAQGTRHPSSLTADLTNSAKVDMGVEHTRPFSLSLSLSTNTSSGIADVTHDATETIFLSVPSSWLRREVRGATLSSVQTDPSTFGYTRWHLPPHAVISFAILAPPSRILLHNPSGVPLQVRLTRVNLQTNQAERDNILIQEASVELW